MKPTQEQVIAWAREAGFEPTMWQLSFGYEACGTHETFERLVTLAYEAGRKDENEACAKVCEQPVDEIQITDDCSEYKYRDNQECADAIRARGQS